MSERTTINFASNNCEILTLNELKQTCSLTNYQDKKPKSKPVEHFELIDAIISILTEKGIQFTMGPIFTSKSDTNRVPALDPDKIGVLQSWLFQRLVCKIDLFSEDKNYTPSIGIGYNKEGMTVAIGTNVRVCSNMSIFGGKIIQSFGANAIYEWEKFLAVVTKWIDDIDVIHAENVAILEGMKNINIEGQQEVDNLIGDLLNKAVKQIYIDTKYQAPLNCTQVNALSRDIQESGFDLDKLISVYDVYNMCTAMLIPNRADIAYLWQDNQIIGRYFISRYNIETNLTD